MNAPDLSNRPAKAKLTALRQRFRILEFENPRTGSQSWRVSGIKRDGTRVRENHADAETARLRCLELETEFHNADNLEATALRATRLSADALRVCETALARLDRTEDLLAAVDHWLRKGRHEHTPESPRLDDAFQTFIQDMGKGDAEREPLRPESLRNLRVRGSMFVNSTPNLKVADVAQDHINTFLARRHNVSRTTLTNDRRALSSFFSWCVERGWAVGNPCQRKRRRRQRADENGTVPHVLGLTECTALLRTAKDYKDGRLAPYVAAALFAGLRPFELRRLTWEQVNLKDREIRLEGFQTKTGQPRTVEVHPTLAAWLKAYKGRPFYPPNWTKGFDAVKEAARFRGRATEENKELKAWPVDCMRHTAVSHFFRLTESYGKTAEQFGNSEAIIKRHYQGRVSTADTKRFYGLTPQRLSDQSAKKVEQA